MLGEVNIAKHCIERTSESTQTIHFAFYRMGRKVRELEKTEINKSAFVEIHEISQDRMDRNHSVCAKEQGFGPLFCQPPTIKDRSRAKFFSDRLHEQVY